jgi:hypothetical protein
MLKKLIAVAMVTTCAAPLLAQVTNVDPTRSSKKAKKPTDRVCEEISVIGSRLATRRVCMTAEQWDARRQDDRRGVDRAQTNNGVPAPQ